MGGRMQRRLILLGLTLMSCGCGKDADRLARIYQKTTARFQGVTNGLREKLHNGLGAVRGSISETSLDSRVALRLRWDKDMAGAEVEVHSVGPGVVELRGTVADLTQRRRAVQLASTTVGADNVRDALTVESDAGNP
jgi:osmotically-inducible protein OsmY